MILIFKFYFFHKDRNYLYPIIDIKQSKNRMFAANISFFDCFVHIQSFCYYLILYPNLYNITNLKKKIMKHTFITFILLSLCIFTYAQKKIAREYIEWSDIWIPGANKTDLPHVLLIGNSITRGYYGKVEAALKEKAYVGRLSNSKSVGDPALIEELAVVLKNTKFDVIHFNNGLHGFDYTEEEYDKSFPKLIKIIRKYAPKAKLIWANTTPVRTGEGMKEFAPITERLNVRNQIALKHINRAGIEVNDLWKVVIDHPEYYAGGDGTHPIDAGYSALANQVIKVIKNVLVH